MPNGMCIEDKEKRTKVEQFEKKSEIDTSQADHTLPDMRMGVMMVICPIQPGQGGGHAQGYVDSHVVTIVEVDIVQIIDVVGIHPCIWHAQAYMAYQIHGHHFHFFKTLEGYAVEREQNHQDGRVVIHFLAKYMCHLI